MAGPLAIIETHPIQYRAPVYRALAGEFGVPVKVIYGSDFSVAGYFDREFKSQFAWDTDLLSGYPHMFLSRVADGGAGNYESVSARGLGAALRETKPGAILLPGYGARFLRDAWMQALLTGRPILFRGETADRPQSSGALKLKARDLVLRWLYGRCQRLLYIGRRSKEHYLQYGCPPEKLVFSPYCVDPSPFQSGEADREAIRSEARRELGVGEDATVLLFSGKISERKGPDLIVEAVRSLPSRERSRIVIVFLGSGEMAGQVQALAEPEVAVRFPGFRNQKDMSRYFHAADLFVLPSRRLETWGLVVNEALHHGLPCVVSDAVGCGPDLAEAGVTGEIFAADSVAALANALQRAFGLMGRREIREACRSRVAGYSVSRAAQGIAEAYAAVAQ